MSFSEILDQLPQRKSALVQRFEQLLWPEQDLERMAAQAHRLTRQYFGRTMRLFAPLYVSNECVNICKYCGFSRDNPILRVTLTPEQVEAEACYLATEGFRNILLVAGEHPKFVSEDYLAECTRRLRKFVPSVSIEVGPMETEPYRPIVQAGAEGLVVYQETYHRPTYTEMHTTGPKKDFDWRLACAERGYAAGFRRLGIGALIGLWDWREELIALAAHAEYLLKKCWKAYLTISLPRLRPAAGEFEPRFIMSDREYAQAVMALRICFPQVGFVLSTREPSKLRNGLMQLGVTMMSAGSHTEPGGYTRAGEEDLHQTVKGRRVEIEKKSDHHATVQFEISDDRSASQMADHLRSIGLEPVWKDWDYALADTTA
jgi:2-iminoacetate synthase